MYQTEVASENWIVRLIIQRHSLNSLPFCLFQSIDSDQHSNDFWYHSRLSLIRNHPTFSLLLFLVLLHRILVVVCYDMYTHKFLKFYSLFRFVYLLLFLFFIFLFCFVLRSWVCFHVRQIKAKLLTNLQKHKQSMSLQWITLPMNYHEFPCCLTEY